LERHIVPEARVTLDFGCGSGPLTPLLADISTTVHALDLSAKMVEMARVGLQHHPNIDVGLIKELPDAHYEVILCSSVIEYVPDDAELIRKFACALRPGGLLLITFPNKYGALQSVQWMSGKRAEYLQHRAHLYNKRKIRALLLPYFEILEKAAIGLPILRQLGLGDLILMVAQKKGLTHAPSHGE
jgi:2-polyprenyl-3-methyl-5-hydroxy-6-metoxy-1,4-benzoquinol methylase